MIARLYAALEYERQMTSFKFQDIKEFFLITSNDKKEPEWKYSRHCKKHPIQQQDHSTSLKTCSWRFTAVGRVAMHESHPLEKDSFLWTLCHYF